LLRLALILERDLAVFHAAKKKIENFVCLGGEMPSTATIIQREK
jgi:hypothetical protein